MASRRLEASLDEAQFYHASHDRDKGWLWLHVDGRPQLRMRCPKCNTRMPLDPGKVSERGMVRYMVHCTQADKYGRSCDWLGLVHLVGWDPDLTEKESDHA